MGPNLCLCGSIFRESLQSCREPGFLLVRLLIRRLDSNDGTILRRGNSRWRSVFLFGVEDLRVIRRRSRWTRKSRTSPKIQKRPTEITAHRSADASGQSALKIQCYEDGDFLEVGASRQTFSESRDDFDKLLVDLQESIRARDHFEEVLVESLALQFLRLARVYQTDAEVAPLLFRNVREKFENEGGDAAIAGLLNGELRAAKFPAADLLMRYESSIWRQIDRIMERIQQWRRLGGERSAQQSHTSEDAHLRNADVPQAS